MELSNEIITKRNNLYHELMERSISSENSDLLARMIAGWRIGLGVLPDAMGLAKSEFHAMTQMFFPGIEIPAKAPSGSNLDAGRMIEREELRNLLYTNSAGTKQSAWMSDILVAGCLGNDHLWFDLGFWSRADLSSFMKHNFPDLANRNVKDMKWKKFLYKQLCESEGIYACRAPSCAVCVDYHSCFGPE